MHDKRTKQHLANDPLEFDDLLQEPAKAEDHLRIDFLVAQDDELFKLRFNLRGGFFDGFFNPTYWPQLFYRTMMMLAISGMFAAVMAGFMKAGETKRYVVKTAGRWGLAGIVLGALFAVWYYFKLPATAHEILASLPYAAMMFKISLIVGVVVAIYFALLIAGQTALVHPVVAISMVVVLFIGVGGGESVREFSRRPYLMPGYMYSNQMIAHDLEVKGIKSDVARFQEEGFLQSNYFVPKAWRTINEKNYLEIQFLINQIL